MLPFEFIINRPPVSQQARRRRLIHEWRDAVRIIAEQHWPIGEPAADGFLMVTILYFFEDIELDVDNIPKPMLDSIKGLVYQDDRQITDLVCRKRELGRVLLPEGASGFLPDALNRRQEFVYIRIEEAPGPEVIYQ